MGEGKVFSDDDTWKGPDSGRTTFEFPERQLREFSSVAVAIDFKSSTLLPSI